MSDNLRRYCAIQKALKQLYPSEPQGQTARHLTTLALFISGIIGSRKCHLPAVANKVPNGSKPQSRVRRLERWLGNRRIDVATYYLPYVQALLTSLPPGPLVLVIDSSEVGRGCVRLCINVVYRKRALPICWLVVKGKKGHLSEALHQQLVQQAAAVLPVERGVVFLGDGEFDGIDLLSTLQALGWSYVCRTAQNVLLREAGERFCPKDLLLQPGDRIELPQVEFTGQDYGPVLIAIIWQRPWQHPLILVSNLDFWEEAYGFYQRRFRIETFFSDQKSRGFYLGHSHISQVEHLNRLLIAASLAYLWMVCLD